MGVIDQNLVTFKDTVGPSLSSMNAAGTTISDSILGLSNSTNGFRSDIDYNYQSSNKKILLGKMSEVSGIYNNISSGVESTLNGFISSSSTVIDKVEQLEKINEEIAAQQKIVYANEGDTEAEIEAREGAESIIYNKNKEFTEVHAEALSELNKLKGQDSVVSVPEASGAIEFERSAAPVVETTSKEESTLDTSETVVEEPTEEVEKQKVEIEEITEKSLVSPEFKMDVEEVVQEEEPTIEASVLPPAPIEEVVKEEAPFIAELTAESLVSEDFKMDLEELTKEEEKKASKTGDLPKELFEYGHTETRTFKSSTGEEIEYIIYIPKNIDKVENVPAMLYLHGYNDNYYNPAWHRSGLTGLIEGKEITPPGIVIMPHIRDHKNLDILKELTDSVVKQYSCDKDRISISGHSYGGIATYKMIDKYKGYFSSAVPISGCDTDSINPDAFKGMKVWAFGGAREGGDLKTSTPIGQSAIESVKKVGGEAQFTVLEKTEHGLSDERTYQSSFKSITGESINPIIWAMKQVKSE